MRLTRRRLRLTRGKITKMSQERQKLSFFLVVIFLAVFGLIVLAEVLFIEGNPNSAVGLAANIYYDEEDGPPTNGGGEDWITPPSLDGDGGGGLASSGLRWMLGRTSSSGRGQQQQQQHQGRRERNERFQKSLARHQGEMESLIRNISGGSGAEESGNKQPPAASSAGSSGSGGGSRISTLKAIRPHNYTDDFLPPEAFDFTLRFHSGPDAAWQPVNGTAEKFYVYSAYYDDRAGKRVVRVIGATRTKKPERVWCRLRYRADDGDAVEDEDAVYEEEGVTLTARAAKVLATVSVIRENWNLKYSAVFVICPIPPASSGLPSEPPHSVSIIAGVSSGFGGSGGGSTLARPVDGASPHADPTNQLRILNREAVSSNRTAADSALSASDDVGVCVKPLHFNYDRPLELVEWLELNRLMGVARFTMYNHTVSDRVGCVLEDYRRRGLVDLLPWWLNMASQSEIRTEGLFAALNDCLYRNMWKFNYLLLADLDEFVVPRHNRTLADMLRFLDTQKGHILTKSHGAVSRKVGGGAKVTSSYSFQNAFFYLQFPDDEEASGTTTTTTTTTTSSSSSSSPLASPPLKLRTLTKTRRKAKFNPQKQRSKYICIPRRVREAGNHFIWEFSEGFNLNVPVSVGFLHHYRVCEFGGDDCVKTESKVDRTAYRYRDDLMRNVMSVLTRLKDKCGLGDVFEEGEGQKVAKEKTPSAT